MLQCSGGKPQPHIIIDPGGPSALGAHRTPDGFCFCQHAAIRRPQDFRMALEPQLTGISYPCLCNDPVIGSGCVLVVDFVADDHPQVGRLLLWRSAGPPVSDCRIYHPSQVHEVVHVAKAVDVGRIDGDLELETFS